MTYLSIERVVIPELSTDRIPSFNKHSAFISNQDIGNKMTLNKNLYLPDSAKTSGFLTEVSSPSLLTKFPSDPNKFGPGTWFNIHVIALNADTSDKIQSFIIYIRMIVRKLPCSVCRDHGTEYVKTNPPEKFINLTNTTGEKIGLFKWSWMFHNDVNARLGKAIIDWDTAYNMYKDDEITICPIGCGE